MKNKALFSALSCLIVLFVLQACDKIKDDVANDVIVPQDNRNIVFHCNTAGAAFELTQLFREGTDATLTIANQPKLGKIEPIGDKIMRYLPDSTTLRGLDSFVIAVKKDGKNLKRTIYVNIGNQIPCTEHTAGDIFNTRKVQFTGQNDFLNIISNDKSCTGFIDANTKAIESVPTRGSVNFTTNQFGNLPNPENYVSYFPTVGFVGSSVFTYKVKSTISDKHFYYANVKVNTIEENDFCRNRAINDNIFWQRNTDNDLFFDIDVTRNDRTCNIESNVFGNFNTFDLDIPKKPLYGTIKIIGGIVSYELTDKNATSDEFEYRLINKNGKPSSIGKVTLNIKKPSECKTILSQDYMQFSLALRKNLSYPVLENDLICGTLKNIKIISLPKSGVAEIKNNEILYTPISNFQGKVRIIYEIETDKGERLQSDLIIDVSL